MFDISWFELLVVAVVALVIIGPKDLPRTLRNIAQWVRRGRRMMNQFRSGFDDMVREAELDELRQQASKLQNYDIKDEAGQLIDPTGDVQRSVKGAVREAEREAADESPAIEKTEAGVEPALAEAGVTSAETRPDGGAQERKGSDDGADKADGDMAKARSDEPDKERDAPKTDAEPKANDPAKAGGERG